LANKKVASASIDGLLKIYDLESKSTVLKIDEDHVISNLTSDPFDRRSLITTSWNKTVKVYDVSTGIFRRKGNNVDYNEINAKKAEEKLSEIYFAHAGCVSCSAFLNNEVIVTGGYDNHAILWHIGAYNSLSKIIDLKGWDIRGIFYHFLIKKV